MLAPNVASMNEEPLRMHATSPFQGWALSEVSVSEVKNVIVILWWGGRKVFCLNMTMGCGIVTLKSHG